jgi:hypothetical protein
MFVPKFDRLFVAARDTGGAGSAVWSCGLRVAVHASLKSQPLNRREQRGALRVPRTCRHFAKEMSVMQDNPRSTASIAGHPIHPMLIPFPIAFFVGTFVSDIVFSANLHSFWSRMSFVLLSAGLVMAALAAIAGC